MESSDFSFSELVTIQFKTLYFDCVEYAKVISHYYSNRKFAKKDFSLVCKGWFENPFKLARLYAEKGGIKKNDLSSYTYGETPITTFAEIAKEAEIGPGITLIECGAGRGRVSLFAQEILGAKVIAYELVPEFVRRLKSLGCDVREEDYFKADFSAGNVIFLYGTTLSDEEIRKLGHSLEKTEPGTLLITVSWYLNETGGTPEFPILKVIEGRFPWGTTNVYIQMRSGSSSKPV